MIIFFKGTEEGFFLFFVWGEKEGRLGANEAIHIRAPNNRNKRKIIQRSVCFYVRVAFWIFSPSSFPEIQKGEKEVCVCPWIFLLWKKPLPRKHTNFPSPPTSSENLKKSTFPVCKCGELEVEERFFFRNLIPFDVWTWAKKGKGTMESLFARL